jgi:hypothetical protein
MVSYEGRNANLFEISKKSLFLAGLSDHVSHVDDKIGSSLQDAPKQPLENFISAPGIPENGELVGRFKRLNFGDVLADFPDRSGIRRKGIKKEEDKEERSQAILKPDPAKHNSIRFKTFFLQFFP